MTCKRCFWSWPAVLVAVLAFGLTDPGIAQADDESFSIGSRPVWFVMAGVSSGGTVALDSRGLYIGGEVSLVRIRDRLFYGLYVDSYYDFAIDGTYLTAGPEIGLIRRSRMIPISAGIDGGAAFRFDDGSDIGATGRIYLTIAGTFSLYGRYMHFGSGDDDRVVQVGIALKFFVTPPFGPGTR